MIGWDEETVQIEGTADILTGEALTRLQAYYFAAYPEGRERARQPTIVLVRVRPTWVRYSDFRTAATVVELRPSELG